MLTSSRTKAFSLPEMLVTIAIIGLMAAVAIPQISKTDQVARVEVANSIITSMNNAVSNYRQSGSDFVVTANADASADEATVMSFLTTYDAGMVGTPFLRGGWPSVGTTDVKTYRARWNGRFFEVVPAGTAGTGLKIKM